MAPHGESHNDRRSGVTPILALARQLRSRRRRDTASRPRREPWSYFGGFGDDVFGGDDDVC